MILIAIGTRPEYLKYKLLLESLPDDSYKVVFTGQHKDLLSKLKVDYSLEVTTGNNRLDSIVQSILNRGEIFDNINYTMVLGDTASAFAIALASFHRQIPIIHVEAGLRTYDKQHPYPEESYRQMISSIADIHFCPTELNKKNLLKEGVAADKIFVVGNTSIDNLVKWDVAAPPKSVPSNEVYITLHRRENHELLPDWIDAINYLANNYAEYEFVFISHPNPEVTKRLPLLSDTVTIREPMEHSEFTEKIVCAKGIISDSGGLQEEANYLNKKIIVCRQKTERPEAIGKTSRLCKDPADLSAIFDTFIHNNKPLKESACLFGDGWATENIICVLLDKGIVTYE